MAKRRASREAAPADPAPAATTGSGNPLVARLASLTEDQRKDALTHKHPLFAEHEDQFRMLLDAFEGSGGFLTGDYLWQYANEKDDEFRNRKAQARYHNYVRSLINIYVRHVFREGVKREATTLPDLEAWWTNVDGAGTSIDAFMRRGAKLALATGLAGALVDKEPLPATGPSKADEQAQVIASWFAAPAIPDWDLKAGEIVAVKLLETKARESILHPVPDGDEAVQYLFWTPDAWARFDSEGRVINASGGEDGLVALGLVPLSVVRPDPSAEHPFLGHALADNGNVFRALYNRCSEEDEVLRDQAFSMLVVSVPVDGDVSAAKTQIGTDVGTTRAIVVQGEAKYVTADMAAPEQIRKNIEFLIREIYRMAHVRYERDSLDAESAEAVRLQHTELNEMLASLAKVLQETERQMAKFWYAWSHPGDRAAVEQQFDALELTIEYPREFFVADLLQELEKWAKAVAMDLGLTFEHHAKKRVVDQLAPDLPQETKTTVYAEIDQQASQREQALEDAQARVAGTMDRFGQKKPEEQAA